MYMYMYLNTNVYSLIRAYKFLILQIQFIDV